MREILFKAKRVDNREWVKGDVYHPNTTDPLRHRYGEVHIHSHVDSTMYHVDPATVCQFTGLLDKNGKRIFEGDIVKVLDTDLSGAIKCMAGGTWYIDHADACMKYIWQIHCNICETERVRCFLKFFDSYELEIIGNIHDKKEGE